MGSICVGYLHDGVDAGDLLEHLQEAAQQQSAAYRRRLQDLQQDPRGLTSLGPQLLRKQQQQKQKKDVEEMSDERFQEILWDI